MRIPGVEIVDEIDEIPVKATFLFDVKVPGVDVVVDTVDVPVNT